VDLLHGGAFVESVVGEGTTVYVVLPFKLPDDVVASLKRA
jgi:signal transduction histidine kinase